MFCIPQSRLSKTVTALSALACLVAGSSALAQVPSGSPVTVDAQLALNFSSPTLHGPRGVAVAPDGTVFTTDIQNSTTGRIIKITSSTGWVAGTAGNTGSLTATAATVTPTGTGITLHRPTAVAIDSTGALYVADPTGNQVLKLLHPETSGAATKITYTGTMAPTALAVDSANNLYIADENQHAIYKVLSGGTTGTKLTLSPTTLMPVGLAVDGAGDVFFADASSNNIYEYSAGGTTSVYLAIATSNTYTFKFSSSTLLPIGMGFDPAGHLYVMDTGSSTVHLFEIASAASWYLVPFSNVTAAGLGLDSSGNLYVADDSANTVDELYYNTPVDFGNVHANAQTPNVPVNFQFNIAIGGPAVFQSVQGEYTGEFTMSGTLCSGSLGTTCTISFSATYQPSTPGLRAGAIGLTDTNKDILAVRANGVDVAGSLVLYPGTQTTLTQSFIEPQAVAVTGDGGTVFVADEAGMRVGNNYNFNGGAIYACASGGVTCTSVAGGGFPTPIGVAVDAFGNLYVADYAGKVYVVRPTLTITGTHRTLSWANTPGTAKALVLSAAGALTHPLSITIDPSGNIYIGDSGPGGVFATAGNPGYIVEIPAGPLSCPTAGTTCTIGGAPAFKLANPSISGTPIIYPQALAADREGNLFVGDGGDGNTNLGRVMVIPVSGATPALLSFGTYDPLYGPSGLSFDAADDLYILDAFNLRVLVAPIIEGTTPSVDSANVTLLGNTVSGDGSSGLTATMVTPSGFVVSPGGQSITIADVGYQPASGTATPPTVYTLNGRNSTVQATGGSASVWGVNTGNTTIDFQAPTRLGSSTFTLTGCGSSGNTLAVGVANTCTTTINFSGNSNLNATFTLNGNAATDYSTLGNQIIVSGTAAGPIGTLTAPRVTFNKTNTATLQNTGSGTLTISSFAVTGQALYSGGTCGVGTNLTALQSCTISYTFTADFFANATITVTDNSTNGTTQTAQSFLFFSLGFLAGETPATGLQKITLPNLPTFNVVGPSATGVKSENTEQPATVGQPSTVVQSPNGVQQFNGLIPSFFAQTNNSNQSNDSDDDSSKSDKSKKTDKSLKNSNQ